MKSPTPSPPLTLVNQMVRCVRRLGGRPDVRRIGGRPDVRRIGGRPDVRRLDGRPDVRRLGGRPDVRRIGGRPDVRRLGGRPDVRRIGGQPDECSVGIQCLARMETFYFHICVKMALSTHPAKVYRAFFHRNTTVQAFS